MAASITGVSHATDIEFDADGVTLRGWLYQSAGPGPHPLVVMAHGLSAVKEMGLDDYAAVFCAAGLAVLAYDNRNLGASGGQPRQAIDPIAQRRDIEQERRAVWNNSITVRSLEYRLDYTAIGVIARVAPIPLLMIVANANDITPTQIALAAYAQAREPKRLVLIAGRHYRPYIEEFVQSSSAAHDWYLQHL